MTAFGHEHGRVGSASVAPLSPDKTDGHMMIRDVLNGLYVYDISNRSLEYLPLDSRIEGRVSQHMTYRYRSFVPGSRLGEGPELILPNRERLLQEHVVSGLEQRKRRRNMLMVHRAINHRIRKSRHRCEGFCALETTIRCDSESIGYHPPPELIEIRNADNLELIGVCFGVRGIDHRAMPRTDDDRAYRFQIG